MNDEVIEALRSANELCQYLWNNTDADNPEAGNIELIAHEDKHANQLAALLNDARTRVEAALHGIEIQAAAVRVPLTDAQIDAMSDAIPVDDFHEQNSTWHIRLARAIERAHGIGINGESK